MNGPVSNTPPTPENLGRLVHETGISANDLHATANLEGIPKSAKDTAQKTDPVAKDSLAESKKAFEAKTNPGFFSRINPFSKSQPLTSEEKIQKIAKDRWPSTEFYQNHLEALEKKDLIDAHLKELGIKRDGLEEENEALTEKRDQLLAELGGIAPDETVKKSMENKAKVLHELEKKTNVQLTGQRNELRAKRDQLTLGNTPPPRNLNPEEQEMYRLLQELNNLKRKEREVAGDVDNLEDANQNLVRDIDLLEKEIAANQKTSSPQTASTKKTANPDAKPALAPGEQVTQNLKKLSADNLKGNKATLQNILTKNGPKARQEALAALSAHANSLTKGSDGVKLMQELLKGISGQSGDSPTLSSIRDQLKTLEPAPQEAKAKATEKSKAPKPQTLTVDQLKKNLPKLSSENLQENINKLVSALKAASPQQQQALVSELSDYITLYAEGNGNLDTANNLAKEVHGQLEKPLLKKTASILTDLLPKEQKKTKGKTGTPPTIESSPSIQGKGGPGIGANQSPKDALNQADQEAKIALAGTPSRKELETLLTNLENAMEGISKREASGARSTQIQLSQKIQDLHLQQVEALSNADKAAKAVLKNPASSEETLREAIGKLVDNMDGLELKEKKTALKTVQKLLIKIEQVHKAEQNKPPSSAVVATSENVSGNPPLSPTTTARAITPTNEEFEVESVTSSEGSSEADELGIINKSLEAALWILQEGGNSIRTIGAALQYLDVVFTTATEELTPKDLQETKTKVSDIFSKIDQMAEKVQQARPNFAQRLFSTSFQDDLKALNQTLDLSKERNTVLQSMTSSPLQ